ncbi:3-isopropylmalate dehydratase large subunit [Novosphingobium sp. HII-3]|uniref:3-isopropylmalate dehydratase large subunit n=1 Tax=Novosphingobium sp. HII-3 TaxID=2075565 RepID=UPI000CDB5C05|nr:3-isopropylmalate dehydratase large subunit [Novosphingobium sp. HII-3]
MTSHASPRTLYDRLWGAHTVVRGDAGKDLIYIDRHLLHEVSTPQSFELLRDNGLVVRRPATQLAVPDHAVPTAERGGTIRGELARKQVALLEANCAEFGIEYLALEGQQQGIVHVISPEQGFTMPGISLVCGDSHTATHGAFGALAFGIGASECGTVMATQTLWQARNRNLRVHYAGTLQPHVTTKDMILALIGKIGAGGGIGHAMEFSGEAVASASMEARMTLCNMGIEAGSRVALVAPDDTTFTWLEGRPRAPQGAMWEKAVMYWRTLRSDDDAVFDRIVEMDAGAIAPQVTFGTSPDQVMPVDGLVPAGPARALEYMGVEAGRPLVGLGVDYAFIGSCTNSRIEDLRAAAQVIRGRRIAQGVTAMVVPGSTATKQQAEAEGLDRLFEQAGFAWHHAGCSLCVAMNGDVVPEGKRSISTSNRNFEGRQGAGARTHLASPAMVAAAAIAGHIVDVRKEFL